MGEMKDRMLRGELYIADDPDLAADFARVHVQDLLARYNGSAHAEHDLRARLLRELLGEAGDGIEIRPPFRCEYGTPVRIGAGTFINFDCIMLDVAPITIGAACQVATRVQFLTATHPIDPEPWLGGGAIVCPGVTIGESTVVGAGAMVTRDLPAGVVAVGSPARVIREIGERDRVAIPSL
jgi:maltose O-acetyltransferase